MDEDPFYKLYKDAGIVPIEVLTNGIVALICVVGIVLNLALVYATIKTKSLHSTCQILIAIYALLISFFLIGHTIKFFVFVFGINYVTLQTCFSIQFMPLAAASLAATMQLGIGIDRLAGVGCPIWYKAGGKFTTFKVTICFCIVLTVIKMSYNFYGCSKHWQTPMMYAPGDPVFTSETADVSNTWTLIIYCAESLCYAIIFLISWCRKAKDSPNGRRLFISLTVIMSIGIIFYIGSIIFYHMIIPLLHLNVFTIEYVVFPICYACSISAYSSTTPVLFLCNKNYRRAFYSIYMPGRHVTLVQIIRNNLPVNLPSSNNNRTLIQN